MLDLASRGELSFREESGMLSKKAGHPDARPAVDRIRTSSATGAGRLARPRTTRSRASRASPAARRPTTSPPTTSPSSASTRRSSTRRSRSRSPTRAGSASRRARRPRAGADRGMLELILGGVLLGHQLHLHRERRPDRCSAARSSRPASRCCSSPARCRRGRWPARWSTRCSPRTGGRSRRRWSRRAR